MWQDSYSIDFDLPEEQIARHPSEKRGQSRLMLVDSKSRICRDQHFSDLVDAFSGDEVLVLNHAKVDHVRMTWTYKDKAQEVFFLDHLEDNGESSMWLAMVSGKKLQLGQSYELDAKVSFMIQERLDNGICRINVKKNVQEMQEMFKSQGKVPLPPYILQQRKKNGENLYEADDTYRYQTVFAQKPGAVAAPTAGLHFTDEVLARLQGKGVSIEKVFLKVGWGTFAGLTQKNFDEKKLHKEHVEISPETAQHLIRAKQKKQNIVSVGTTTLRALEWWAAQGLSEKGICGDCDLFLYPPHRFEVASSLITNFHLPKSSLFLLVAAFLGGEDSCQALRSMYLRAIEKKYLFYSYGDAMMIRGEQN